MSEENKNLEGSQTPNQAGAGQVGGGQIDDAQLAKMTPEELRDVTRVAIEAKRQANREAADRRIQVEALEAKIKTAEEKDLLEKKRFEELYVKEKSEREALEAKHRQILIRKTLETEAMKLKIHDPDDIALINVSSIESAEDIAGIAKLVEKFKKAKPHKFEEDGKPAGNAGRLFPQPGSSAPPSDKKVVPGPSKLVQEFRQHASTRE